MYLTYPPYSYELEVFGIFPLLILEAIRVFLFTKGNKTEESLPAIVSIVFSLFSTGAFLYYCNWQTYVMILDIAINSICLIFIGIQLITGILFLIRAADK
jgi:hypothetical protein